MSPLCATGEVFDYLVAHGRMKEKEARAKFRQVSQRRRVMRQDHAVSRTAEESCGSVPGDSLAPHSPPTAARSDTQRCVISIDPTALSPPFRCSFSQQNVVNECAFFIHWSRAHLSDNSQFLSHSQYGYFEEDASRRVCSRGCMLPVGIALDTLAQSRRSPGQWFSNI